MRRLVLLVVTLPLAVAARPQDQATASKDWLSIKEWWGVVEVVETREGSLRQGQGDEFETHEWTESQTSYFAFHLNSRSAGASIFPRGASPSAADLAAKERWQSWECAGPSVEFTIDGDSRSKDILQSIRSTG